MKKSDITKQNIIKEATKLFFENGYELTSTKQLAQATKYSEGLIFKYFYSKQGLLNAVMMQITSQLKDESVDELTLILKSSLSFQNKLTKFIENRIIFIEQNIEVITIIIHQTYYDKQLRNTILKLTSEKVDVMIENFLHLGVEEGIIDETCDLQLPVSLIKNLIYEMVFVGAILRQTYDKTKIFAKVDIIIKGVGK